MSVATLNTKATGYVEPSQEDVDLTFADIVEAGFTPPPNPTVDLSATVPVVEIPEVPKTDGPLSAEIMQHTFDTIITKTIYQYVPTSKPITASSLAEAIDWMDMDEPGYSVVTEKVHVAFAPTRPCQPMKPDAKDKVVEALRTNGHRQIRGRYGIVGGPVCAMGLLMETLGGAISPTAMNAVYAAGIGFYEGATIAALNDSGLSFPAIADWIVANL